MESSKTLKKILDLSKEFFEETHPKKPFVPFVSKIPVTGKVLTHEDLTILLEASLDLWLTNGRFTDEFEKKLSHNNNSKHCLFVNSGSSANLLAVTALKQYHNLKDGDEVITAGVNFPTTLNPIIQNNLVPVLVDVQIGNYNINADLIEENISNKTRGIVLAHTLGNPFDLEKILKICKKYNLFLMEDMCDALGSEYKGEKVGNFGDVATLSFYPAHHITTGEGGAVLTNNPKLKKLMLSIRDWGRDCYCAPGEDNTCKKRYDWQLGGLPYGYDHKYIYSNIGYNLKATDMQAAIGVTQLDKLDYFIKKRLENFNYLYENFRDFEEFILPTWDINSKPSWFGFPITINQESNVDRRDLLKFYESRNIGTRLLFAGKIINQPAYKSSNVNIKSTSNLPISEIVQNQTFWLGVYPGLTEEMLNFVLKETNYYLKMKNK